MEEMYDFGIGEGGLVYPCVVEFGLYADHVAFFFVLCSQDLEL